MIRFAFSKLNGKHLIQIQGESAFQPSFNHIRETLIAPFVELSNESLDFSLATRKSNENLVTLTETKNACYVKAPTESIREADAFYKDPMMQVRADYNMQTIEQPLNKNEVTGCLYPGTEEFAKVIRAGQEIHDNLDIYELEKKDDFFTFSEGTIEEFAQQCFQNALKNAQDCYLITRSTQKTELCMQMPYIVEKVFRDQFQQLFKENKLYFGNVQTENLGQVLKNKKQGFIWIGKSYDFKMFTGFLNRKNDLGIKFTKNDHIQLFEPQILKSGDLGVTSTIYCWQAALKQLAHNQKDKELHAFSEKLHQALKSHMTTYIVDKEEYLFDLMENNKQIVSETEFLESLQKKL